MAIGRPNDILIGGVGSGRIARSTGGVKGVRKVAVKKTGSSTTKVKKAYTIKKTGSVSTRKTAANPYGKTAASIGKKSNPAYSERIESPASNKRYKDYMKNPPSFNKNSSDARRKASKRKASGN